MKAVVYKKYGPPEVAKLMEVDKPVPKENELLVKVYATTVNRTDSGFRSAEYFISRFWSGLLRPKYTILGCEFAGVIEEIGRNVTTFKKGNKVFGYNDKTFGGHGEYLTISENDSITFLPNNLSFEEAAPMTEGSHYALNNIRASKIKKGQNALVYGASGAIGSAAVQLLKFFEVNVTAVCNTKNVELIKSLGADVVFDYQTQDFTKTETKFDFIFDAVGKTSFAKCKPLLTKKGIYISTELGKNAENIFFALFTPIFNGKKVLFPIPTINKEDVVFLKELAEKRMYKPVIERQYTLEQIIEAYKYVESGQKTGNVVIKIVD
ncbi:NAD(P)-dependent alcohol dehydrogenase [Sediminibacterium sp.]|uniref:NAD(P)-dependent alcohol dehydrogenase n=1 Tax=Sediminibacterium sp. TaxID=1917865 RepID=UPI0027276F90|nr:NAD(P)-dependent alcohol dehydrogenase [Sediminibacterium sp.]MDO9000635.1 NAD(P)-dependent alcohol dehydrogenase [Bacteroidota bacterium]MDP3146797.1 NAD(P)-dependent alcohol dehydrogenase [Bacteroidota bacterium]MDP3567657.1 NAD(P)-dependent alcohol dehydrogenase [Sediminibacterium sp.]